MVAQHHLGSELAAQSQNCNALRSPRSCLGVGSHVSVELTFPFYLADMSLLLKKESILLLHCLVGSPVDPGVVPLAPPHSGELRTQKLKSHLVRTQSLNGLSLKPGVGQYIAIHAMLTARDFFLSCLFVHFQSIHLHFFQNLCQFFPVLAVANTWFLCRPAE